MPIFYLSNLNPGSTALGAIQAGSFEVGREYTITSTGTTDYTLIGAASIAIGVVFIATGVGIGTGTATATGGVQAGNLVVGRQYTIKITGTTVFTLIGAASLAVGTVFIATGAGSGTGIAIDTTDDEGEASFEGSTTEQPITNSTTRALTISTATVQGYFKFYMSGGKVGVSYGSSGGFTFSTPDTTRSNEFISLLAKEVFGSSEATDLFSNKSSIVTSWNSATATALNSLNGLINTAGITASLELVNAMFDSANGTTERFVLSYGFANSNNSSPLVTGTGYAISGGSGSGAKVNVTMKDDPVTDVKRITVHTSGSSYAKGNTITITDGSSNTATITLNSYQASMLNGTLSNSAGTEVPLETNDVIRVLYTITSTGTQENTSGDAVTASQTFFADYTLN